MTDGVGARRRGGAALWKDIIWEPLLTSLELGTVVPVIGPELSQVLVGDEAVPIGDFIARRLVDQLELDFDLNDRIPTIGRVISVARRSGFRRDEIYSQISIILRSAKFAPTRALRRLAQITDFRLFVTLGYDTLLEQAIEAERGVQLVSGQTSISYWPNGRSNDLPEGTARVDQPTVFYLLGRHGSIPQFAVTDADLLDQLFALQSAQRPKNLLDLLKNQNLLLLGGAYPDWLLRFLLRLTKQKSLADQRDLSDALEILADSLSHKDVDLVGFLSDFSSGTRVFHSDAATFIDQLWERWSERRSQAVGGSAGTMGGTAEERSVFISYAREDVEAARVVAGRLSGAGLNVWMDESELEGGQDFPFRIESQIQRCRLFVPLMSRSTEERTRDAWFRREWRIAERRQEGNAAGETFVWPIIVDSLLPHQLQTISRDWTRLHIQSAVEGRLSDRQVAAIKIACGEAS